MKITYENKNSTRESGLPRKNSVTADDLNEIKESVNYLYDNGPSFNYDPEPTESSENLVKSGGIWSWVLGLFIQLFSNNNEWTGTQEFQQPIKVKSNGTDAPLVVRDSSDSSDMFSINPTNGEVTVNGNGNDGAVYIKSPSGNVYPKFELLANGVGIGSGIKFENYANGAFIISSSSGINARFYTVGVAFFDDPNSYPSSIFTVSSNTKGVLLSRGTFADMNGIINPANGLEFTVLDAGANWGKWMYSTHTNTWNKL